MRIGTWNLAGRWSAGHRDLLASTECDVLLLTEVSERVALPGYDVHLGRQQMLPGSRWSAIASRIPMRPEPDPHGASAMAELEGLRFCSSVLPWRACGDRDPWVGGSTAERTVAAVRAIEAAGPAVWGGDWNHALSGREWAGSLAGRQALLATIDRLDLRVPTASLPHQIEGLLSIDHLAVPRTWTVTAAHARPAVAGRTRLSDHDVYVVEVSRAGSGATP